MGVSGGCCCRIGFNEAEANSLGIRDDALFLEYHTAMLQ